MDTFILKRFGYASEDDFKQDIEKLDDPDYKGNAGALCARYGFASTEDMKVELEDGDNKLNGLNLSFGFEQPSDLAKDLEITVPEAPEEKEEESTTTVTPPSEKNPDTEVDSSESAGNTTE